MDNWSPLRSAMENISWTRPSTHTEDVELHADLIGVFGLDDFLSFCCCILPAAVYNDSRQCRLCVVFVRASKRVSNPPSRLCKQPSTKAV